MLTTRYADRVRGWLPVALIFLGALAVRLGAVLRIFPDQFFFGKYLVLGKELYENGLIAERPFSYAPIYCYVLALGRAAFGDALWPLLVAQSVVGAGSCVLLYWIGVRLLGRGWALLPAAIACVYRSFVVYDVTFLSDSLGLFLQLAFLAFVCRSGSVASVGGAAVAGSLAGLAVLHRANNALLVPLAILAIAIDRRERRPVLRLGAAFCAATALVALPIVLQNLRITGTPGITASNPGYIFHASNNAASHGFRYSPPELYQKGDRYYQSHLAGGTAGFRGDAEIAAMISGAIAGHPMRLGESSRFYLGFTLAHMGRYPAHYAGLLLRKAWLTFHAFEPHDVPTVFAAYPKVEPITPITFGLILPLGLLGLALTAREWRRHLWLYVVLVNHLTMLLTFYVVVRFRLPIEAVLILTTGLACKTLWVWGTRRAWRSLLWSGAALVALAVGSRYLSPDMAERARGMDLDALLAEAQRLHQRGEDERAVRALESLLRQDHEVLPRVVEAHRRFDTIRGTASLPPHLEAAALIRTLEEKRRRQRLTHDESRFLTHLLLREQDWEAAEDVLADALRRRPYDPLIRFDLARALLGRWDLETAQAHLLAAMQDGLLFTTRGLHGCHLLAQIGVARGDREQERLWSRQASRQSILTRWYPDDEESRAIVDQLRVAADYVDPGDLERLFPYAPPPAR